MISVEEAIELVLQHTQRQEVVEVGFEDSLGMVLAEDLRADLDMPPFNRSAMDGYAVVAEDTQGTRPQLQVVGFVPAGSFPKFSLTSGQAAKIMTGAPLPAGADAVREIEQVTEMEHGNRVEILQPVQPGEHVVPRAAEVKAGEVVLTAGTFITPAVIGLLAAIGSVRIKVFRMPRIAILATGDELVDPAIKPLQGQIRNSNSYALRALCRAMGLQAELLGVAKDDLAHLRQKLQSGLQADVLIITGGASVGDLDLVDDALREKNAVLIFDRVAIKPGKPAMFAKIDQKVVFALPGNPVSSSTVFEVIVRPALRKMMGYPVYLNQQVRAKLTAYFANKSNRANYHPAVTWYEDGQFFCRPLQTRGSGDITSYARCNSYLICPREKAELLEHQQVEVLLRDDYYMT